MATLEQNSAFYTVIGPMESADFVTKSLVYIIDIAIDR